jgi:preprotein translocase subunit SecE
MGRVKDEPASPKPAGSSKAGAAKAAPSRSLPSGLARFFGNFLKGDPYKPTQGWNARLWTAIGLGALVVAGLYTLHTHVLESSAIGPRLGVPAILGAALAWVIYRLVNFPPFADFLIATEAEMNKVSWITWPDLKRATVVVIVTVLILALYLFAVDLLWQALLKFFGVLKFASSGFGSQAG